MRPSPGEVMKFVGIIAILGWPLALAAISDDVRWLGAYVVYALAGIAVEFRRIR